MATKSDKHGDVIEPRKLHRIRITLTSTNLKAIERMSNDLIANAKKKDLAVAGPVRLPRKILRITTRKSPCGEGTNTWDRFEMRVYKRLIDLDAPSETMKEIININLDHSVTMEATITQD